MTKEGSGAAEPAGTTTEAESNRGRRLDRNWQELLQELRVAQTGVQILTGFLLTIPFTSRFADLNLTPRVVYGVVMCVSIAAVILLMTPVALHRALFHRGERPWLIEAADTLARCGLVAMGAAMVGTLWLILDVIASWVLASAVAGALTIAIIGLWVVIPHRIRARQSTR